MRRVVLASIYPGEFVVSGQMLFSYELRGTAECGIITMTRRRMEHGDAENTETNTENGIGCLTCNVFLDSSIGAMGFTTRLAVTRLRRRRWWASRKGGYGVKLRKIFDAKM